MEEYQAKRAFEYPAVQKQEGERTSVGSRQTRGSRTGLYADGSLTVVTTVLAGNSVSPASMGVWRLRQSHALASHRLWLHDLSLELT